MVSKVDLAFNRLLRAFNKKRNVWKKNKDGKNVAIIGSWTLDSGYGGYRVAQISNLGGGESDPFGYKRRKPSEFVKWVNDTILALKVKRGRR
jgi:hypothetical protein